MAGLFEGEGCLTFSSPLQQNKGSKGQWTWQINMIDEDVIRHVHDLILGSRFSYSDCPSRKASNQQPQWYVRIYGRHVIADILEQIKPFLFSRRMEKINEFFEWYKLVKDQRDHRILAVR